MQLIRRFVNWILGVRGQPLITAAWKQPPPRCEGPATWGTFGGTFPTIVDSERVPRHSAPREFRAVIEWYAVSGNPTAAAEEAWQMVRESEGPIVTVTDPLTGATEEIDLYPWGPDDE